MEITKRVLVLGVALCAIGVGFAFAAKAQAPKEKVDEVWMAKRAPAEVDGFRFIASAENPLESYRMDQGTYDMLDPFGIVSRIYRKVDKSYDVVLIASDKRESFHSPNVCLPAQGWNMSNEHDEKITTKTRGTIPVTVAELDPPNHTGKEYIAFFYRVQDRFIARGGASIFILTLAMFEGPMKGNFDMNTVFYRFTSQHPGATKEELLKFVGDYLDTAYNTSNHYF